jgi:hypothetical protein
MLEVQLTKGSTLGSKNLGIQRSEFVPDDTECWSVSAWKAYLLTIGARTAITPHRVPYARDPVKERIHPRIKKSCHAVQRIRA